MVNNNINNIFKAHKWALSELNKAGLPSAKLESLVLLCFVLNCDKTYIYTHSQDIFPEDKLSSFKDLIFKRAAHIPLQYLTGFAEFMSLKFNVNSSVLIPRQDTEILVETVLEEWKSFSEQVEILDIGTGSGCIAISLAKYIENCHVTALDISTRALETAKGNAELNKVGDKMSFIESNLFSNVGSKKFHIIVSNPPYIPSMDVETLMPEVREHEPLNALDGGSDGLDFYKRIIEDAPNFLHSGGLIAFEAGIYQASDIYKLLEKNFYKIAVKKDLSGIDRVVFAYIR